MKPDWPNTQSHTLTTTTHIHPNTCLIISCTHMHTHTFSFSSPPLHTLTSLTLSVLWLFLGGLVLAAVFLWVCVCVLVRVSMHACMHACWINIIIPSPTLFEYQSWIFPLPHLNPVPLPLSGRLVLAHGWQEGWSAPSQAFWLVRFMPPEPAITVWRFLWMGSERWSTQGCVVSGLFFKGGTWDGWFSRSLPRWNTFFIFICILFLHIPVASDQVLLPSDPLFEDCFSSHTHWHQAWPKQDWDTISTGLEIHKFLYEVQLWSLSVEYLKSASGAWYVSISKASLSVWNKSSATSS